MLGLWLNITTHKMILLPYRFCGDKHHAFAFPFVLIFLPLRLSCKESSTSNKAFLLRRKDVTALLGARNRYALRLAGHQSPRHGCAGWDRQAVMGISLQLYCRKWVHGGGRLGPPELYLIAVSLCTCRRSNGEYSGCDSIGLWDDHMTNVQARFTTKSIKIFVSIKTLIMHIFYQPTHLSYFHLPVSACHLLPLMF